ncbi:cupin domain-containing protein [Bacteroidota bacterium]
MVIKHPRDIPFEDMSKHKGVKKQIYIGPKDGSNEIVMRYFSVEPGYSTPYHCHNFPHVVKVEKGNGVLVNMDGTENDLSVGKVAFVDEDEIHCFKNTGDESFDFLCIVPLRGEQ